MTATRDGFCRNLMEDAGAWSCQRRIGPERMAGEFVRFFGVPLRPTMEELKELLREAGFGGGVSEAGHLPDGMRGVHYSSPHGGYDIRYLKDQPEGAAVHTVLHETYEIIHETLCGLHSDSPPSRAVCREANRFAAATLMQPDMFSLFAQTSGFDAVALQKQYRCSYASATLRLAEVMRRQPLMAVLYEREEGDPLGWAEQPTPSQFRASVVARTPGFGMRNCRILCGARGGTLRRGKSLSPGSLAHRVLLTGRAAHAEQEPGRNGAGVGDIAAAARPVFWHGRLAKIALVAVPHRDRAALQPQLANDSFDRLWDRAAADVS